MAATYEPGSRVTVSLPEGDVSAEVVVDHGGETVIVHYQHPHLDRDTGRVPIARALLSPAADVEPPGPADDGSVT
jgi:hypothetical protein